MKGRRSVKISLIIVSVFLIALIVTLMVLVPFYKEHMDKERSDKEYDVAFDTVSSLNWVGGGLTDFETGNGADSGLKIERKDHGYQIYLGSELEKCLKSICENYTKSTDGVETVTPEQVRTAITDNVEETVSDCKATSSTRGSNFLYKMFKWMGGSCEDTAIYIDGSGYDRETTEKGIRIGTTTNYTVIRLQVDAEERGGSYPCKFKWQE